MGGASQAPAQEVGQDEYGGAGAEAGCNLRGPCPAASWEAGPRERLTPAARARSKQVCGAGAGNLKAGSTLA